MSAIEDRLRSRLHLLDGASGTLRMQSNCRSLDIHRAYLEAGADIISTDTFNSNPLSLEASGRGALAPVINRQAAILARSATDAYSRLHGLEDDCRPLVAGSMGPTAISLSATMRHSPTPQADFNRMAEAFYIQAKALIEGGVDLLLLETIYDLVNAKAAIAGIRKGFEITGKNIPVMVSATLNEKGILPSGDSLEDTVKVLKGINPISIGLNCGYGIQSLAPHLIKIATLTDTLISFHPNAGLPDETGHYSLTPAEMLDEMGAILQKTRINIIGGCCGTTPEHIHRLRGLI